MDQNTVSTDENTHFVFDVNHLSGIFVFYQQEISEIYQVCLMELELHMSSKFNLTYFNEVAIFILFCWLQKWNEYICIQLLIL